MAAGGAERVAITLMREFIARGHEVDLVLLRAEGDLMAQLPAEVTVVDLGASGFGSGFFPFIRYLRSRRPHAIQISMWPLTIFGIVTVRLSGVATRIIVSDHAALSQQFAGLSRMLLALKLSTRIFYPFADERVIVSKLAGDDLSKLSGIPRAAFRVIYNPVPAVPPFEVDAHIEALWGDCEGRLITVGSFKEQKNHSLLIRSFALLRRKRRVKLMIVGQGHLLEDLRRQAQEEGVLDDVVFVGFAANPYPYMASADLFVLSSDYEGYPLVLIEAMRVGLSIVSTDCLSGPREILEAGRYGRLVPCRDATALAAAMDHSLREPVPPAVLKARAEELSGDQCVDTYLQTMLGSCGAPL